MFNQLIVFAEEAATTNTSGNTSIWASLESMLPMLLIIAVMFFFLWFSGRNQRKRAKILQERKNNLKNGDRVMMQDGLYGIVTDIKDDIVTIAVGPDKVQLVFNKEAISTVEYDDDKTDLSREEAKDMSKK